MRTPTLCRLDPSRRPLPTGSKSPTPGGCGPCWKCAGWMRMRRLGPQGACHLTLLP